MKSLSSHIDTPAVQKLEARYGVGLRDLPRSTQMAIVAALGCAAHAFETLGFSEEVDVIFTNLISGTPTWAETWAEPELYALLRQLDGELTAPQQAISLVAGIAEGLAYASV